MSSDPRRGRLRRRLRRGARGRGARDGDGALGGSQGHRLLTAAAASGEQEQLGLDGESRSVVTGYGPMWNAPRKRPRYDTEDRQASAGGAIAT
ncbi:hypothetical protein GN244_ATG01977 [Phytophthora infestans]|uniref:Uncharacterized protein n=1 Tax=Phytophthora infestans TaxID=4787 RepID=A0A833X1I2_PHYIN|nr:hypothetical protein GN244_ATG01977 [Phytophthora infestans]